MDSKTIIIIVAMVVFSLVLLVGALFFAPQSFEFSQEHSVEEEETYALIHQVKEKIEELKEEKEEEKNSQKAPFIDHLQEELEHLHQKVRLEIIPIEEIEESYPPRKYIQPKAALSVDQKRLENLHVGSFLIVPDIDNNEIAIKIDGAKLMDGSSSYFGSFALNGVYYPSIITIGEDGSSYIHLQAPQGSYEIELLEGKGYIYKSEEIHAALDDGSDDTIEVNQSGK